MKIKCIAQEAGGVYLAAINEDGEHRKSVEFGPGQEVVIEIPGVESGVEFGEVTGEAVATDQPDQSEPDGGTPETEAPKNDESPAVGVPGLGIGRAVTYRSRTGDYDVPAVVTATAATLNPKGVESGNVPPLSGNANVHLTVFTPGKPGLREGAEDFKEESEFPRSENVAGCYQEWDIPPADEDGEIAPGTWRWPERV